MVHDHDTMLWRVDAVDCVRALRETFLREISTTTVSVDDTLTGRVLANPVVADVDIPGHSHATMDGFAVDATDPYPLTVVGDQVFPEDDPSTIDDGQAIRIATGAPLPEGTNAVLKVEDATVEGDRLRGDDIAPGTYTYERGSNVQAGEILFEAGEQLSAKDALLLCDLGVKELRVREPFTAGLLATGSEIHEGTTDDLDSPMLAGLLRSWGHEPSYAGTVPDEYERVESAITNIAESHDVVITTGGTSVGEKDYVIRALAELGEILFHRVRVRPGKPIAVAHLDQFDAVAFAVPGKPIGAHTIATLVMRPFFTGADESLPAVERRLACDLDVAAMGFEYVVPVVSDDETATPLGHVDSPLAVYEETFDPSVLSSSTRASRADAFFVTEAGVEAGDVVDIVPYGVVE